MNCPICNAWTNVCNSRKHKSGMIKRRRVCGNDHRFNTFEIAEIELNNLRQAADGQGDRSTSDDDSTDSA